MVKDLGNGRIKVWCEKCVGSAIGTKIELIAAMWREVAPDKWECVSHRQGKYNSDCANCGALKADHIYYPGQPLKCPTTAGTIWKGR